MAQAFGDLASITGGQPGPNPFTIGGLTLNSIDNPTELSIGTGEHKMTVQETVGGGKVVHTTGFQPDVNTWAGKLHQPGIDSNVAQLRGFMVDGKERLVTWKGEQYYGIVRTFKPTYQKGGNVCLWQLAVEITRAANGAFSVTGPLPSTDSAIATQFDTIDTANTTIQNVYGTVSGTTSLTPGVNPATEFDQSTSVVPTQAQQAAADFDSSLATTTNAIAAATPTATASTNTLASATSAVADTQSKVPPMLAAFPTGSASAISAGQIATALSVVRAQLGTVQTQSVKQVQGGSLFALAATKYGDMSKAYAIMSANGIVAPQLPGSKTSTITLPPLAGVFNDGKSTYTTGFTGAGLGL